MSLARWQSLRELTPYSGLDRLFDEFWLQPFSLQQGERAVPLDIVEKEKEIVVRALVPGFEPDQIDVEVQGDTLTLRGTAREEREENRGTYYLRESHQSSFNRSVRLPATVQAEKAEAEYRNGVLTLRLPKTEDQMWRRIPIKKGR